MKRKLLTAALAATLASVALLSPAKAANTRYLSQKGAWSTFIADADTDGKPICGMQVVGRGVSLMVKYQNGDQLFMQIFKYGWNIPSGTDIPGYLAFDKSEHFPFEGKGGKGPNGEGVVTLGIKPGTEEDFLGVMADADKMIVGFTQGTQPPLIADMAGSRDAVNVFRACSSKIDQIAADAPQPFAKQTAPQPFGNNPVQQQPAAKRDDGV